MVDRLDDARKSWHWLLCSLPVATWGCGATQGHIDGYAYEASALNVVAESAVDWDGAVVDADNVATRAASAPPEAVRSGGPSVAAAPQRRGSRWVASSTPPPVQPSSRPAPPPIASRPAEAARAAEANKAPPASPPDLRAVQRVEAAQALLGTPGLQDRAFVAQVLRAAAQDVAVDPKLIYAAALWIRLEPKRVAATEVRPGDLVFFRDTSDINNNGKPDDGVTMVGVVEQVRGHHVVFIAQRVGKVRRLAVDASRPLVIRDAAGDVVNTRLVRWPGSEQPWTTGQCLTGFARPQ